MVKTVSFVSASVMLLLPCISTAQTIIIQPQATTTVSFQLQQQLLNLLPAAQSYLDVLNPKAGDTEKIVTTLEDLLANRSFQTTVQSVASTTMQAFSLSTTTQALISTLLAQVAVLQAQIDAIIQERATATTTQMVATSTPATESATSTATSTASELITPENNGVVACPVITRFLSYGSSGTDVTNLQLFLADDGLLEMSSVSGFFGKLTETAVQAWQFAKQIVTEGTPTTTGYGAVGAKTRAALAACR